MPPDNLPAAVAVELLDGSAMLPGCASELVLELQQIKCALAVETRRRELSEAENLWLRAATTTTEVDRVAQRAEAARSVKAEVLAMLGHELRNPLAPILTAMQMMRAQGGDAFLKERTIVERNVEQMIRVVDDLLADTPNAGGPARAVALFAPPAPDIPARPRIAKAVSRRILIVDDNVDAADLFVDALVARGHVAVAAYDGPSALALTADLRPELAFLDIGLPGMDGYELARRMATGASCPVLVALTGYGQVGDRSTALAAGFTEHLVKPLSLATMVGVIDRLMSPALALPA